MKRIDGRPLIAIAALLGAAAAFAGSQPTFLWLDEYARPTAEVAQALTYIRNVRDEGLDPADFDSVDLDRQAAALPEAPLPFDSQLTQNMLRYLEQLHMGRVDPRAMGFDLARAPESHDFETMLRSAVREHRLETVVASLVPPLAQYRGLRDVLKSHRSTDPSSPRIRQVELALERLRWLPEFDGRVIVVNIPMFRVWGWDPLRPDSPVEMAVIVGRARGLRTPVFTSALTDVVFRPYWNVPASIMRNEILPAIRRDPNYLARHNMEIVSGSGADLRVRQRPGPANALGLVKFVFPNKYGVYMHATPTSALFHQERRDFSHGCVRVEDPVTLAEWVLQPQPDWSRERIVAAMNGDSTQTIRLLDPVNVVMFYMSAAINPADGTVRFADDIYRHDARLDAALKARSGGGE
jgi:murein L,D-transpeptidase YcbB/YkuD